MCSTLRPRSSSSTRSPFSVSSLAAQPPEIPEPTTIASYSVDCIASSLAVDPIRICAAERVSASVTGGLERELELHLYPVTVALLTSDGFRYGEQGPAGLLAPHAGLPAVTVDGRDDARPSPAVHHG